MTLSLPLTLYPEISEFKISISISATSLASGQIDRRFRKLIRLTYIFYTHTHTYIYIYIYIIPSIFHSPPLLNPPFSSHILSRRSSTSFQQSYQSVIPAESTTALHSSLFTLLTHVSKPISISISSLSSVSSTPNRQPSLVVTVRPDYNGRVVVSSTGRYHSALTLVYRQTTLSLSLSIYIGTTPPAAREAIGNNINTCHVRVQITKRGANKMHVRSGKCTEV